jgi:hypothetical protein
MSALKKSPIVLALLAAASLVGAASPAPEAKKEANVQQGSVPAETSARLIFLAAELEDMGRAQKDSLLLINAARLYLRAGGKETKVEAERFGGGDATAKGKLATPKELLDLAKTYAQGNEPIEKLIDQMVAAGLKGRTGGAKFVRDTISAKGVASFKLEFYSQEFAEAAVRGDGGGNLDLTVSDENGNVICQSKGNKEREYCSWFPRWKGQFKVTVQNQGAGASNYRLYTN